VLQEFSVFDDHDHDFMIHDESSRNQSSFIFHHLHFSLIIDYSIRY
jgi:hypothetical protein